MSTSTQKDLLLFDLASLQRESSVLLIIDSGVENYESLLTSSVENAVICTLNADEDGVEQITDILKHYFWISHIHLVSHGAPGCLFLGSTQLDLSTVDNYAEHIQNWISQVLVLYSCNVAAGNAGSQLIEKLRHLTGADVIATTPAASRVHPEGDWDFDITIGDTLLDLPSSQCDRQLCNGVCTQCNQTTTEA